MTDIINIAIAEDHELVREGFVAMLKKYPRINILFEANDGKELIKGLKNAEPDIVLLDIEMPVMNGIDAIIKIKQLFPKIKIIVISAHSEETEILEYVKLGADSFLPKHCKKETLLTAILSVQEDGRFFEKHIATLIAKVLPPAPKPKKEKKLTERDLKFLKYYYAGKDYSEIARLMNVVEKTLIWYKHIIMAKTNSKSMEELQEYLSKREITL